eukprot:scaffold80309_cov57-Attheya_sp.AAC.1
MPNAATVHMVLDAWRLLATTTTTATIHPTNEQPDDGMTADTAAERAHELLQFIMDRNNTNDVATNNNNTNNNNDNDNNDNEIISNKQPQQLQPTARRKMMIPLDIKAYTLVIDALSKCGEAEKAEGILTDMLESGMTPDAICWNATIHAWSRWPRKQKQQQQQQQHDNANDIDPGLQAAQRAQELLDLMLLDDPMQNHLAARPTVATFNAVIDCYSKSGIPNAGYLAEDVVRRMKEWSKQQQHQQQHQMTGGGNDHDPSFVTTLLEPNTITLTSLMDCWSRSTGEYGEAAAERAEAILQHMQEIHMWLPMPSAST